MHRVQRLARAMVEGRWQLNGETMQISPEGIPINGMHRLEACVLADVPFRTLVAYGVPLSAMPTIDTGKTRTSSNILQISGHSYYTEQSAAVSWIHRIISGLATTRVNLDPEEILTWVRTHPELVDAARASKKTAHLVSSGIATALYWLFSEKDPEATERFFSDFATGSSLEPGDPVLILRDRIVKSKAATKKLRMTPADTVAVIIRAWNFRRAGEKARLLIGTKNDVLPRIE